MADYATLKAAIQAVIYENGNQEITGSVMQATLLAMVNSLGANYQYAGIATPSTNPGTPDQNVFYLAGTVGTYVNFDNAVVQNGSLGVFLYNGSWQCSEIKLTENVEQQIYEVTGQNLLLNRLYGRFVNGNLRSGELIPATRYRVATDDIMVYNYDIVLTPSDTYKFGIHYFDNGVFVSDSGWKLVATTIPKGQQFKIVIAKRSEQTSVVANVEEFVSNVSITNINSELDRIDEKTTIGIERINNRINGGNADVILTQGGYTNGVPNFVASRVRFDRMFFENELGVKISIPSNVDARLYGYNLYSEAGEYTSFLSYAAFPANTKEVTIDKTFIGNAKGVSVIFCRASNYSQNITPADMAGTTVVYIQPGYSELEERIEDLEDALPTGNSDYFGHPISLPITSRVNKLNSEVLLTHTPNGYSHTKYNQSMAAYNGKLFCFNDTSFNDGFCVIIDIATKNVVAFVQTIPTVLVNSHVNNACFTDVFFDSGDTYPLILISRGDYPNGTDKGKEMYVFRVVESGGVFSFTLIKTIKTDYYFFGASWEYDTNRKMIWGHLCKHGDWRWGDSRYRKFNDQGLYFLPDSGTNYICIGTNELAAVNAEITITLNGATTQTKTVNVQAGQVLSSGQTVIPYAPGAYGYAYIKANQSANAFSGQYIVYSCDENGQNRRAINYECVIGGFMSPDLADEETVTIPESEITLAKMDSGIFQGGCYFGGKLFLPFQSYETINGMTPSYTGHCCLVVNPESGEIETMIPTDSLENEGCAIVDGVLFISSHNANASGNEVSFKIMKYVF